MRRRLAFTVIELLLVAVIVAVLTAGVLSQVSTTTSDAKSSNLRFNLRTIRSQLEVYKRDHGGRCLPANSSAEFRAEMTEKTAADGTLNPRGLCGPYLQGSVPLNPFTRTATVAIIHGAAPPASPSGTADGWQYNPEQGWFYPNNADYFRGAGVAVEAER